MPYADPTLLRLNSQKAAHAKHAKHGGKAGTAAARAAIEARFLAEARELAGPTATDADIAQRAASLRKRYYTDLAIKGVLARKAKAAQ